MNFWKELGRVLVIGVAFAAAFYLGPFLAGAAGLTGGWAVAGSSIFGAAVGGFIGGAGFAGFGLGSFRDGFRWGAIAGAFGGGFGFKYVSHGSPLDLYNNFVKGLPGNLSRKALATPSKFLSFNTLNIGISAYVTGSTAYSTYRIYDEGPGDCESLDIFGAPFGLSSSCTQGASQ
jgi:hypothetical protein